MERHVFYLQVSFTSKAVGKYLRSHGSVCQSAAPVLQENRDFPHLEGRFSFFRPMKHFRYSCYFSLKKGEHLCAQAKKADWVSEPGWGYVSFSLVMWSRKVASLKGRRMRRGSRSCSPPAPGPPRCFHEGKVLPPLPSAGCPSSYLGTRCPQSAVKPGSQRKMVSEEHLILLNYFHYCIVNLATKWVWNRSWRF